MLLSLMHSPLAATMKLSFVKLRWFALLSQNCFVVVFATKFCIHLLYVTDRGLGSADYIFSCSAFKPTPCKYT